MFLRKHYVIPETAFATYDTYLGAVGSSAVQVARRAAPNVVLDEIRRSGLRGRGGAGFPTGTKWSTIANHSCETRYVVCNAAEGEPGTFKDRWLLRKNPYAVLEGLLIAAYVVNAKEIYIVLKGSFVKERQRLETALVELRRAETLGQTPIHLVEGPEEYLLGEEKALLNVIEGEGPLPREAHYPPYEVGLFATPGSPNPALVNNVETFAHVSTIIRDGADSFRRLGTSDTPGTIIVTLTGALERPGCYEVEAGIPLRAVLDKYGGGARAGRTIKAIIPGVTTAALLPPKFDTRLDFGSMQLAGSALGSAGFIVIDEDTPIPRVAQSMARFLFVESCNQCPACKQGLGIASSAIDELFDAKTATPDDWERATVSARSAPQGNRCYLPVQGSLLIPNLLEKFHPEFDRQLAEPTRPSEPWLLPKITDYDDAAHTFQYDMQQQFKQPDWTYRLPDGHATLSPPEPTPRPTRPLQKPPEGRLPVTLSRDLSTRLRSIAADAGLPFDRQVEAALRDWLRTHNLD